MAEPNTIKILEITNVTPQPTESPDSVDTEFSLSLTFLDLFCLKFPPIECLFFYPLTESYSSISFIISRLIHALSLTLHHFLPLAGNLCWPSNSPKPIILYNPGDAVSLTIAESNADFDHLSTNHVREAEECRPLVPCLRINEKTASTMATQITIFPKRGFCIAITAHHAVLDGKSSALFMKSWAYICRENSSLLPPELSPFFDRSVVKDPNGLDVLYLNRWLEKSNSTPGINPRIFDFWYKTEEKSDLVRGTFELTRDEIEKIRKWVLNRLDKKEQSKLQLSMFVLTCSHVLTCMVKATIGDFDRKIYFILNADYRSRLDPPVPDNYFGNCIGSQLVPIQAREVVEEDGLAITAAKITCSIKCLKEAGVLEGAEKRLSRFGSLEPGAQVIAASWSPRFGDYGIDFGWGRPRKVEIASINTKAISLVESRDGTGGVEVGLVLKKSEMDIFASIFKTNLYNM